MTNYRTNLARINDDGDIFETQFYFDNEQEAQEFLAGSLNGLTENGIEVTDLTLEHKTENGWELTDFSIHDAEELWNSQEYLVQEGCGEMFPPIEEMFAAEIEEELEMYRVDAWGLSQSAGESKFFTTLDQASAYAQEFIDGGYEENAKFNGFALYDPENNQISFDSDESFDINNWKELHITIEDRFKIDNAYDLEPEELKELTESLGSKGYTFNPDFNLELDDEFGFDS